MSRPTATDSAALAVRCQHRRCRRHLYHHHHHLRLLPPSPPPRFPCLHLTFPLHPSLSFFHSSYLCRYARARSPMLHVLNPLTPPSYFAQPLPTRTSISTIFLLFNFSSLLLSFFEYQFFSFNLFHSPIFTFSSSLFTFEYNKNDYFSFSFRNISPFFLLVTYVYVHSYALFFSHALLSSLFSYIVHKFPLFYSLSFSCVFSRSLCRCTYLPLSRTDR